jgi:hypothetical protein
MRSQQQQLLVSEYVIKGRRGLDFRAPEELSALSVEYK